MKHVATTYRKNENPTLRATVLTTHGQNMAHWIAPISAPTIVTMQPNPNAGIAGKSATTVSAITFDTIPPLSTIKLTVAHLETIGALPSRYMNWQVRYVLPQGEAASVLHFIAYAIRNLLFKFVIIPLSPA